MRFIAIAPILVLTACATQDVVALSGKARFADYPDELMEAIESACTGPAQTFRRPEPALVECREFLPPATTAALILQYDGTPEDLPELVIQFRTQKGADGVVVENDVYVNVPQKAGAPRQVRRVDPRLNRTLAKLYERAGGVPE